ncbi:hypothetical protein [Microbacterium yannicii]|uniref:hypothetical protein n=1 Tax=Microbacterium yannicii TaxID=671622 RepID=UPI000381BB4C|nr:hypothetical protein [Microbacterium yannicii]
MSRPRVVLALAVVGATAAIAGCGHISSAPEPVCVPVLHVEPEAPRAGRIVTVTADPACPAADGTEWTLRIQPADARIPLAQAVAEPAPDGTFSVEITVPPTMQAGPAIVWITNYWDAADCPGNASCASAEGRFTVSP